MHIIYYEVVGLESAERWCWGAWEAVAAACAGGAGLVSGWRLWVHLHRKSYNLLSVSKRGIAILKIHFMQTVIRRARATLHHLLLNIKTQHLRNLLSGEYGHATEPLTSRYHFCGWLQFLNFFLCILCAVLVLICFCGRFIPREVEKHVLFFYLCE